jgi:hypothetical protein
VRNLVGLSIYTGGGALAHPDALRAAGVHVQYAVQVRCYRSLSQKNYIYARESAYLCFPYFQSALLFLYFLLFSVASW